jgi:TldD protein
MKELTDRALNVAELGGASYADIRIVRQLSESLSVRNGKVGSIDRGEDHGFGVRVIVDGAWGFSSSSRVNSQEIERVAREAVAIARASTRVLRQKVSLARAGAVTAKWKTPYLIDPFSVPLVDKLGFLMKVNELIRSVKGITVAHSSMDFRREEKVFANSESSFTEQEIVESGVGFSATASNDEDSQTRSYPNSFRGQHQTKGYELIEEWPLIKKAPLIAEEAVALLAADLCPSGEFDLLLDSTQLALQIHESMGHPAELDRVLGSEASYAGRSFLTVDKLNNFKYGSDIVNLTADSLEPGGLGTYGHDDEGVPGGRWHLVKNGAFVGYLTSRETAPVIGEGASRGAMRADGWNRIPLIRMNNVSLQPGSWKLKDLIEDTDYGILMDTNRSWSIDQLRYNFQFGCEIGWEIKGGKKGRMFKNPTYQGITPDFWSSCDAICGRDEWMLWGTPNCGKGQPGQIARTGHGASPTRFKKVKIGVGYAG